MIIIKYAIIGDNITLSYNATYNKIITIKKTDNITYNNISKQLHDHYLKSNDTDDKQRINKFFVFIDSNENLIFNEDGETVIT
jgi:hypothetical protein